jgi:hypothetical protein
MRRRAGTPVGAVTVWLVAALAGAGLAGEPASGEAAGELSPAPASSSARVLAMFLARPDEPTHAFRAVRRLEVTSGALGKSAWLEARVELDPQRGFRYSILAAGGPRMLQNHILLKVLRAEQEVYQTGTNSRTALTEENYLLEPGGCGPSGLVRLLARARRKEVGLLNGEFLVTLDSADLVEVSGIMAKRPSFWIPRVELTKQYARIGGHRVNVRVESTSHVRVLGASRFLMTTDYQSIEGEAVAARDPAKGTSAGRPRYAEAASSTRLPATQGRPTRAVKGGSGVPRATAADRRLTAVAAARGRTTVPVNRPEATRTCP